MYSRILVAVDESDASKLAIKEAIGLAKDQKATLYIVYIAKEFIPAAEGVPVDFTAHEEAVRQQGNAVLKKLVRQARRSHKQVEHQLIEIVESDQKISARIIAEANEWKADLIVIGTHGRTGLLRLLLGSVAEEVIRNSTIPIHIVRSPD